MHCRMKTPNSIFKALQEKVQVSIRVISLFPTGMTSFHYFLIIFHGICINAVGRIIKRFLISPKVLKGPLGRFEGPFGGFWRDRWGDLKGWGLNVVLQFF